MFAGRELPKAFGRYIQNPTVFFAGVPFLGGSVTVPAVRIALARTSLCVVLSATLLAASGCKKSEDSPSSGDQPASSSSSALPATGSGYAKVTYQPTVHAVEQTDVVRTLRGISSDGSALLFDSSNAQVANLKSGDILLLKGIAARKVLLAENQGSQVVVITRQATLPEVVQSGNIHLDAPIRFGTLRAHEEPDAPNAILSRAFGSLWSGTVFAQGPDSAALHDAQAKGRADAYKDLASSAVHAVVDDWDSSLSVTPAGSKV